MVLLGPSGCGKTTVVRSIAGLIEPSMGEIYIDEKLVNNLQPKDRDVSMVFQNYALYPHMSVYDNIAFPLKMRKFTKQQIDNRVRYIAELLEIDDLLFRKPRELSGGQMQRVALGRALIREPKVFLLDEPLSNLDAKLRINMRTEIKKLQKKVGVTTLYITHDQVEAMSMADTIAVMKDGMIQQIGTPLEIYNNPSNIFVAGFVGNPPMNFLNCKLLKSGKGEYYLELANSTIQFRDLDINSSFFSTKDYDGSNSNNHIDENLTIGIRPKDILFLDEDDIQFSGIKIIGEISYYEILGDSSIVEVKTGNNILHVSNVDTTLTKLFASKQVTIGIPYNKIHLFRTNTGERINNALEYTNKA